MHSRRHHHHHGVDAAEKAAEHSGNKDKHYRILREEDIKQLQENDISTISNIFSVSRGLASTLLSQKNWNLSSFYDEWFADEPSGILGKRKSCQQVCNICFEEIQNESMVSASCGHPFCTDCWKTYIITSINDGPVCLTLRCPEPACQASVCLDMVDSLVSGEYIDKYYRYLYRSYVELSRRRKWCPAPGCELAIEFNGGEYESYDVTCDCSYRFCWKCTEESHRPIDCTMVAQWLELIHSPFDYNPVDDKWVESSRTESPSSVWIVANTKACPNCKRPIEKNQGCNRMTCRSPCKFQFCWACLEPWKGHVGCNGFGRDVKGRMVTKSMMRYEHYYERWQLNDRSRKRALVDLDQVRNEHVGRLVFVQGIEGQGQVQFVMEAWEQIDECRRVLKWTYAYGYFLSLDESSRNKMIFFECLQGEAEAALERLHHCAEKEMDKYLYCQRDDFRDFRFKLAHLTLVTRTYFENLVKALEDNLAEVV